MPSLVSAPPARPCLLCCAQRVLCPVPLSPPACQLLSTVPLSAPLLCAAVAPVSLCVCATVYAYLLCLDVCCTLLVYAPSCPPCRPWPCAALVCPSLCPHALAMCCYLSLCPLSCHFTPPVFVLSLPRYRPCPCYSVSRVRSAVGAAFPLFRHCHCIAHGHNDATAVVDRVERSLALGVQLLFISDAIQVEDWQINTREYPNITASAAYVRSHGLGFGIHTLPYPPGNAPPQNLVQDGPAPTYRSGRWTGPSAVTGLEDMGFWWGHDNKGSIAVNGNPNGPCPQLVPGYDCSRWVVDVCVHAC